VRLLIPRLLQRVLCCQVQPPLWQAHQPPVVLSRLSATSGKLLRSWRPANAPYLRGPLRLVHNQTPPFVRGTVTIQVKRKQLWQIQATCNKLRNVCNAAMELTVGGGNVHTPTQMEYLPQLRLQAEGEVRATRARVYREKVGRTTWRKVRVRFHAPSHERITHGWNGTHLGSPILYRMVHRKLGVLVARSLSRRKSPQCRQQYMEGMPLAMLARWYTAILNWPSLEQTPTWNCIARRSLQRLTTTVVLETVLQGKEAPFTSTTLGDLTEDFGCLSV